MKKFRDQIKPVVVSVSFWWCWASETLQGLAVDKVLEDWLTTTLLPMVYWHRHRHLHLTQNSQARENYRNAWDASQPYPGSTPVQCHVIYYAQPDRHEYWLVKQVAGSRYFCERFFRASCSKNQQKSRDRSCLRRPRFVPFDFA
jgi:hypothetical protein